MVIQSWWCSDLSEIQTGHQRDGLRERRYRLCFAAALQDETRVPAPSSLAFGSFAVALALIERMTPSGLFVFYRHPALVPSRATSPSWLRHPAQSRRPVSADVATVRSPFVPHCAFPSLTSLRPAVPRPAPSSLLAAFRRAASLRFHASGLVHTAVIQTAVPSGGGVLLAGWRHRAEGCGALRVHRCSLRSRKSGRSWFGQVSRRYATCRPSLRSAR